MVKQVSIFLENKSGRIIGVTRALGDNNINIRALSIADTSDFGILRLIVNQPDRAVEILKEAGFVASVTEVIAVEVPDNPGGLASVLEILVEEDINIEYLYSFVEKPEENALILFRVEDNEKAVRTLKKKGVQVVPEDKIYSL